MARAPGTLRVGRYFLALAAVLAVLYLVVFFPGNRHTPKLGLDLVGGQQVIFQARAPGGKTPTSAAMSQAKQIMEERVNGSGVTESTVVIQGDDQIVVSIPGGTDKDVRNLGAAAVLNFRGVVAPAAPIGCSPTGTATASGGASSAPSGGATNSPSSGATSSGGGKAGASSTAGAKPKASGSAAGRSAAVSPNDASSSPLTTPTSATNARSAKGTVSGSTTRSATPSGSAATSAPAKSGGSSSATVAKCTITSVAQFKKLVKLPAATTVYKTNGLSATLAQQAQAALSSYDCAASQNAPDRRKDYYIACEPDSGLVYLLGPVVVPGSQIDSADALAPNTSNGGSDYTVQLTLKDAGSASWADYTGAHNIGGSSATSQASPTTCGSTGYPCADFVAFTLDGQVVSAPVNESAINGQATQISGNFSQESATTLARQLQYGALPLSFQAQQAQSISATLGSSQLKAGLLAGGIGLVLVVVYSMLYYRALGLVTIASLLVSGALTYAMLVLLGTQIGFTLSLAGIAGFIVAVGITADSFVVFFERIKDEVHEGRSVRVAVPRAWARARRTILSADTVSFLAAAILYFFAAGDVKGFAFTLGLSTVLDLIVVFLFTHPLVSLLSRSRAFGSARFTGLDAVRAGGIVADEPPVRRRTPPGGRARGRGASAVLERPAVATTPRASRTPDDTRATDDVVESESAFETDDTLEPTDGVTSGVAFESGELTDDAATQPTAPDESPGGAERRRTTPDPSSAAERAAARRARLREQRDNGEER